jgi:hypothetical protein
MKDEGWLSAIVAAGQDKETPSEMGLSSGANLSIIVYLRVLLIGARWS